MLYKYRLLLLIVFVHLFATQAYALSARVIFLDVPGGQSVDRQRDHLMLSVENGWISNECTLFSRIISSAKGGAIQISSKVTYKDNFVDSKETFTRLENVNKVMNRPLGIRSSIYSDLPAEISTIDTTFKIAITNEDTIAKILNGLEKGKENFPAMILPSQYIGYSKAISVITQTLFGTNDSNYPFFGQITLNQNDFSKEHYILMVSPNQDSDNELKAACNADFSFKDQQILFKDAPLNKWSYVLLKLSKAGKSDIKSRV
ncbi:MAG: hypothetical protein KGQ83_05690, partial [Planctomycetes bacterium]|nr:hypothetical protein [Planctomycetota bacterium]